MFYPISSNIHLSEIEYKKYARHLILDNIGINGQKRFKATKVLFVGAGGLAASSIIYLVAAGIGYLGIIDNDIVTYSNLHRQILYNYKDVGKLKVEVIRCKVKEMNSECCVSTYSFMLNKENCGDIIKNYDIIIDTTDNFKSRYVISRSCYLHHKIHVYGAVRAFEGHISVFNYKGGPLYSDLYPINLNLHNNECNGLGVLGILTGIIGIFQAIEVIKIILGTGSTLSGYLLVYNLLNASAKKIKICPKKNKNLISNKFSNKYIYLNCINNSDLLVMSQTSNVVMIDVRKREEFFKYHISKSINIPLKNINSKTIVHFANFYCNNKSIVVYCYDNFRSFIASQILFKKHINHYVLNN
uniref:molybdopterin biosynthesis protein n=1 Tax=Gracilaria urvillei TaxID=172974 RepID=UPI001D107147|nr:molybdopterin biosynthesis protein [Hydropuntia urvillei]UAD88527.1 molybdopterin biosynthesis protein [Hydropuntia urvillei]